MNTSQAESLALSVDQWQRLNQDWAMTGCVLVQGEDSLKESLWLLDQAENCPVPCVVVAWVDVMGDASRDLSELHDHPAARRSLRGIRLAGHHLAHLGTHAPTLLDRLAADNLVLEVLVDIAHLRSLTRVAVRHPALKVVVDHAGRPRRAELKRWARLMSAVASSPNTYVKVSGLWSPGSDLTPTEVRAVFTHLFNTFGAGRLMWGSDWPMPQAAGRTFSEIAALSDERARECGMDEPRFWSDTARTIYRVGPHGAVL